MDVPHKPTRPSTSYARRLLLPPNLPPPPIPPALLSRTLKPRKPLPQLPQPKWIDGGEFALARSSSTSQSRCTAAPHRRPSEHSCMQPMPTGPPVLMPYANTGMEKAQSTSCQPQPPLARHDLPNSGHLNVQAGPASHHHHHHPSSSCPISRSNNDKSASDERTRRVSP